MRGFYDYFKELNNVDIHNIEHFNEVEIDQISSYNEDLSLPFTVNEIQSVLKALKNNISATPMDNILNEYLKNLPCSMLPVVSKLFNIIFDSGFFPEIWSKGVILPLYKNKGDINDPDNYRGITILSCFGK
jgi:hypothetical protein